MDISSMNERIFIQHSTPVADKYGNHKNVWTEYYVCYAAVGGEQGDEEFSAGQTVTNADIHFTVRDCNSVKEIVSDKFRIIFRCQIYDIIGIDHMRYKHDFVRFKCRKARR